MTEPRSHFYSCAGRKTHFLEWGDGDNDTVIIWHGVTGTCQDHAELAATLSKSYHVICPDSIGCGQSDWCHDKKNDPGLNFYATMAKDLLRQLNITTLRWIGASKGGGLGIILAAALRECEISHLILDDVGPGFPDELRKAALKNIAGPPHFNSFPEFKSFLIETLSRGGLLLDDRRWHRLAKNWCRQTDKGEYSFHNDPALANQFRHQQQDFDLWSLYDRISAPTLLIRAEKSIIPDHEAQMMQERGPKCKIHNRPGGHISLLHEAEIQDKIISFLASPAPKRPI